MNKIKKRFVALLVVFTSIISFLPVGFNGQAANAATISAEAATIQVYNTGSTTPITATTDTTVDEQVYSAQVKQNETATFDIVLKDVSTDHDSLLLEANTKMLLGSGKASGVVKQQVEIISINGISCATTEEKDELNNKLGISISESHDPDISRKTVGQTISGLPLGVNKIKYNIIINTEDIDYTAAVSTTAADGTITTVPAKIGTPKLDEITYGPKELSIYYGSLYVTSKISSMIFKAYTETAKYFDDNDIVADDEVRESNVKPFLYSTEAKPDSNMPLKYTFDVPDSIATLKYIMTFDEGFTGATIYKNGVQAVDGSDYSITGNKLTGSLGKPGESDLIVIKLDGISSTGADVKRLYSIEVSYNYLDAQDDYSIRDAGITKESYEQDNAVKAYIGKKFDVTKNAAGFTEYAGDIYIDRKAGRISIDPDLIRTKDSVAYVVTNNYYDSVNKKTVAKSSELKNGKQWIDFKAGSTINKLQVDVFEGKDGSKTASSKLLARYNLNVNLLTSDTFALDLDFKNVSGTSEDVYLTQPGVKENDIDFKTDRRTYDLYSSDPVMVSLALKSEKAEYTGIRSGNNEYLRVWLADNVDSNNLKEAQASQDNPLDSDNKRSTSLSVDLNGAKKMVVQAYYDDFSPSTTEAAAYVSYAVGSEYVFYLPNNYDGSDVTVPEDKAANANLNSLKVQGGTLEDSDGNEGFSSEVFDYTVTVDKDDTKAKITAIPEDDNVKSIVATIDGSEGSYDLVSGEVSELPLDQDGKTSINIVVTAQDGTTIKTYKLTVKNNTKSSNVNLKNVILNVGDYTFDSTETTTKVRVSQNTTRIKVTPVSEDSKAIVTVNGTKYTGSAININLKGTQETDVKIVVESEDGTESKTYTLEVYRTDSANWDNSDNNSEDSTEADQYYDEYNECWVDTTKYEEWGKIGSKPAYFDKNNRQVKEAWISTGGKLYYLNSAGYRSSGWKVDDIDGKTYYLDPTTGEMKKGWMNLNNSWYYLELNGVMHKGWLSLNQKLYYFTPNGQMVINQSMFVDGKVYKFGQDGAVY